MNRGFSLVELSIVLVILGLLTGGILAGQSLIRAAELRGIVRDVQTQRIAVNGFNEKYLMLPGDFSSATRFWGRMTLSGGCPGTPSTATATGTCDGNGDGSILFTSSGNDEYHRVYEHLSKGGMVNGNYSYNPLSSLNEPQAMGIVYPKIADEQGVWLVSVGPAMSYTDLYQQTGTFFKTGKPITGSSFLAGGGVDPAEAYSIDMKVDDGRPGLGGVLTERRWCGTGSGCETTLGTERCVSGGWILGGVGSSVTYNLGASGTCSECDIYWRL